jgi:hypothetical protein
VATENGGVVDVMMTPIVCRPLDASLMPEHLGESTQRQRS